ncbi:MAG: hypothetical protein ABIT05_03045 [Chitinophagaceae bacterium]
MKKIFLAAGLFLSVFTWSYGQQPSVSSVSFGSGALVSRAPDSRGWTDPALNHNRLIQQRTGEGVYKLIGPYKVVGTQFLYGEHHKGDLFATEAKAYNIFISYNTFNQEVEFYSSSNPDKPLVKEPGEVDSFTIQADPAADILSPLKFIYGAHLGTKDKFYYQEVAAGDRFVLYKRYKSELGYVSSNYVQAELRQFDLGFEYYYYDKEKKNLKKLKANASSVTKEFKGVTDISKVVNQDDFDLNQEAALQKAFEELNKSTKGF